MSKTLTNKVVADQLNISPTTLKRWLALLEEAGYAFFSPGSTRKLREEDVPVLKKLQVFSNKPNCSLEQAVQKTIDWHQKERLKKEKSETLIHASESDPILQEKESIEADHQAAAAAEPVTIKKDSKSLWSEEDLSAAKEFDHLMMNMLPGLFWKGKETQAMLQEKWTKLRSRILGSPDPQQPSLMIVPEPD